MIATSIIPVSQVMMEDTYDKRHRSYDVEK
jgi:hypothetical protein